MVLALAQDILGLGENAELSALLGANARTAIIAAGTTQGTAAAINVNNAVLTAAASQTGGILSSTAVLNKVHLVQNSAASTASAIVYPPLGGAFNGGTTNAGITVAAGQSVVAYCNSYSGGGALNWTALQTASTTGAGPIGGQTISPRLFATGGLPPSISTDFADVTPVITTFYYCEMYVDAQATVTGFALFNGTAVSGNIKVGLADSNGNIVATSASTAQSGTAAYQLVPFTAPFRINGPSTYYALVFVDNTTARFRSFSVGSWATGTVTGQVYATGFTNFVPTTTFTATVGPVGSLY